MYALTRPSWSIRDVEIVAAPHAYPITRKVEIQDELTRWCKHYCRARYSILYNFRDQRVIVTGFFEDIRDATNFAFMQKGML